MTNLDQFESEFRSATRTPYVYSEISIRSALIVMDDAAQDDRLPGSVRAFLQRTRHVDVDVQEARQDRWNGVGQLLSLVEEASPDLIVTYRSLGSDAWRWPFTLGDPVEVLTQSVAPPVLMLPHPAECDDFAERLENTDSVMAITDHLTGDHRLVNYAVSMTEPGGKLVLSHVEDKAALDRILDAISKIPEIDTETAEQEIGHKLLKAPREYIDSIQATLAESGVQLQVHGHVVFGHQLKDHMQLVEDHHVDLLVLNTKDEDQLALHGIAYPLTVQLRQTPLLML
jgi:hypothetical protein